MNDDFPIVAKLTCECFCGVSRKIQRQYSRNTGTVEALVREEHVWVCVL